MQDAKTSPRGINNKNPLNLRKSSNMWMGKVMPGTDNDFEQFISMQYGIRAAMVNIRTIVRRHRGCTLRKLIEIWAPAFENNTCAYINRVCQLTGYNQATKIDIRNEEQIVAITHAMAWVENGQDVPIEDFERAYKML